MTTAEALYETISGTTRESLASARHPHQIARQGLICRGRFSDSDQASQFLWLAQILAIKLRKLLLKLEVSQSATQPGRPPAQSAPQYWVSPQAPEGLGLGRVERLLDHVRLSKLCQNLFGLEGRDLARWKGGWQCMDEDTFTCVENAARLSFGDPSLPYPDMEVFKLWIKMDQTSFKQNSTFLRICIHLDPDVGKQDCKFCHIACLVIDYMDPDGAVKINVPLLQSSRSYLDSTHFHKKYRTKTETFNSTWHQANYLYQGLSYLNGCSGKCRMKKTKRGREVHCSDTSDSGEATEEDWTPSKQPNTENFEPFPSAERAMLCQEIDGLAADVEYMDSDFSSLVSDEDSSFDPFPAD